MSVQGLGTNLLVRKFSEVSLEYKLMRIFLGVVLLGGYAFFSVTMMSPLGGLSRTVSIIATNAIVIVVLGLLGAALHLGRKQISEKKPKQELEELQKNNSILKERLSTSNQDHEEQLSKLRAEKNAVEASLNRQDQDRFPELSGEKQRLSSELARLQEEHTGLQKEYMRVRETHEAQLMQSNAERDLHHNELLRMQEEHSREMRELQDAPPPPSYLSAEQERELQVLRTDNDTLKAKNMQKEREFLDIQRDFMKKEEGLKGQILAIETHLKQREARIVELTEEVSLAQTLTELSDELYRKNAGDMRVLEKAHRQLEAKYSRDLDAKEMRIEFLIGERKKAEQKVVDLEKQLAELNNAAAIGSLDDKKQVQEPHGGKEEEFSALQAAYGQLQADFQREKEVRLAAEKKLGVFMRSDRRSPEERNHGGRYVENVESFGRQIAIQRGDIDGI